MVNLAVFLALVAVPVLQPVLCVAQRLSKTTHILVGGPRTTVSVVESLLDVWSISQSGVSGEYVGLGKHQRSPEVVGK